jgi:hypothetical protein
MGSGSVTRVDDDLMAAAKLLADTMSRSAAQQLSHWARIGLELERGGEVSHADIVAVLSGRRDYDQLSGEEQAVVRAEWSERLAARIATVDLRDAWAEGGQGYVGLDDEGNVVRYEADGTVAADGPTARKAAARKAPARRVAASTTTPSARRKVATATTSTKAGKATKTAAKAGAKATSRTAKPPRATGGTRTKRTAR